MRSSLIALAAACAATLLPVAHAQTWTASDRDAPELYWAKPRPTPPPFTTSTTDFDIEGTDGGFAYLEARPTSGDDLDDGVWVTLLTRVSFTDLDENEDIPLAVRTNADLTGAQEYDWDSTDDHPPVIMSQARFDALIDDIDDTTGGYYTEVTKRFQPFVGSSAAAVRWDAMYPHWPANATRAHWRALDIPQTGQIFDLEDIIAQTITDQTGGVIDGEDFMYRWGYTASNDSDMRLEFQPLYVHGSPDPAFDDGPVPVGPTGGFKVGTSTPLTYIAFGLGANEGDQGTSYPVGVGHTPVTGNAFITAGAGFAFNATQIGIADDGETQHTSTVYVVLSPPGGPVWHDPNPWLIYKLTGEPPKVLCPAWVPTGTAVRLEQFDTPYGLFDPIPSADQETFYVGS